jgi:hypothetical protein
MEWLIPVKDYTSNMWGQLDLSDLGAYSFNKYLTYSFF